MSEVLLRPDQVATLEAVADTIVPGCKRSATDVAISGVDQTPGAVAAGALDVLTDPATGIADGVGEMADLLNSLVDAGMSSDSEVAPFVGLTYERRRELLAALCTPENPSHELWFLVMLFAYMAYDSAPHLDTAVAMRQGHVGLTALGFHPPDEDGLWRHSQHTYGRVMARPRSGTDENGNLP